MLELIFALIVWQVFGLVINYLILNTVSEKCFGENFNVFIKFLIYGMPFFMFNKQYRRCIAELKKDYGDNNGYNNR